MDRRKALYALLGVGPATEIAWGQVTEKVNLPASAAEAIAASLPRFFNATQLKHFAELGDTIVPSVDGRPGSKEAEAAEFLDFLLGQSPADVQSLYRQGLATYITRKQADAKTALKELTLPIAYKESADPYRRFLEAAKQAFWQATVNSRVFAEAMSQRSRGAGGVGSYWLPIE